MNVNVACKTVGPLGWQEKECMREVISGGKLPTLLWSFQPLTTEFQHHGEGTQPFGIPIIFKRPDLQIFSNLVVLMALNQTVKYLPQSSNGQLWSQSFLVLMEIFLDSIDVKRSH
eukprot:scaffold3779_cov254-Ochromonas_danica.AAC.9